jgi:hypothetical protein
MKFNGYSSTQRGEERKCRGGEEEKKKQCKNGVECKKDILK